MDEPAVEMTIKGSQMRNPLRKVCFARVKSFERELNIYLSCYGTLASILHLLHVCIDSALLYILY